MKQIAQSYSTGELSLLDVPAPPAAQPGRLLVRLAASLLSLGTERAMIEVARKTPVGKALARPDWVRQMAGKIRSDGIGEALRQAKARLDAPVPLGYSAAGVVVGVGAGVSGFRIGDPVACGGYPFAAHSEVISVPAHLGIPIRSGPGYDEAAYVMLGAIALNAVRLARPELGENVAVLGLGLLGLIGVQLLKAAGCRVLGADLAQEKLDLALQLGADRVALAGLNLIAEALEFSGNAGVDSAIVFAASEDNAPVEQAAEITRERGRVVVPGLVKLNLPRKVFFEKELELVVPRSAGPEGSDGSRWTEGRNLAAFLELVAQGRVRLAPLTTHRFPIARAHEAYDLLLRKTPTERAPIGILLEYDTAKPQCDFAPTLHLRRPAAHAESTIGLGLIGAGLFARGVFLPVLKRAQGVRLRGVAAASGLSARHAADAAGFEYCTTEYGKLLGDESVDAVLITTRHSLHARMVVQALDAGKHVFVEKPLALTEDELRAVLEAWSKSGRVLMVGFNRRFAPATRELLKRLGSGPAAVACRVNAGPIPPESWVHGEDGGGRIIGEVCHFIDLVHSLGGGLTRSVAAAALAESGERALQDTLAVTLALDNGSIGSIVYLANGDRSFSRERVEVFRAGSVGVIDNFRRHSVTSGGRTRRWRSWSLDRGHRAELELFFDSIRAGRQPVPVADYAATTLATFRILDSLASRSVVAVERTCTS